MRIDLSLQMLNSSENCFRGCFEFFMSPYWSAALRKCSKHCSQTLLTKQCKSVPNNIRDLFGNTLTHHHVEYYICVCYHQNFTLHKDVVNTIQVLSKRFMLKLKYMENSHFDFLFKIFDFSIFFNFLKSLASNIQGNPNIENQQLLNNGVKTSYRENLRF